MTLIKFEPLRELENFNNRIQRFFGEFPMSSEFSHSFNPRVDISEDENNIFINAEVPGVKKDDIKISLQDNILTISGEKKSETKESKDKNYYRNERIFGSFTRSFTLPEEINPDKVDAKFSDGILNVTIEKAAPKEISQRFIDIK
ncbi:MAG: Hsp20/alpha crystallin family protein [Ignavibacteriales bacterium]|nr:MAG: Hsp20/alpha crystallin family protein [Ignavibacteriales bacterium]